MSCPGFWGLRDTLIAFKQLLSSAPRLGGNDENAIRWLPHAWRSGLARFTPSSSEKEEATRRPSWGPSAP